MSIRYDLYSPFVFANVYFDMPHFETDPKGRNLYDALKDAKDLVLYLCETHITCIDHDTGEVYFDIFNRDAIQAEMEREFAEADYMPDEDLTDWYGQLDDTFYGDTISEWDF